MTDERQDLEVQETEENDVSRRDFIAMSVAAGVVAAAGPLSAAEADVVETDVTINMPDGMCDAAFFHPNNGSHPGRADLDGRVRAASVDARDRQAHFGRGLHGAGAESFLSCGARRRSSTTSTPSTSERADMAKLQPLMGSVNAPGNPEKDAVAYIAWLDAAKAGEQVQEDRHAGLLHGRPAGREDLRRAAGSRRRRRIVPRRQSGERHARDSPHLLAPKIKAQMYFGIASNDDMRQPDAKDKLKAAFIAANHPAEIEVYQVQARLVRVGHAVGSGWADLQQGRCRARLEPDWSRCTRQDWRRSIFESGRVCTRGPAVNDAVPYRVTAGAPVVEGCGAAAGPGAAFLFCEGAGCGAGPSSAGALLASGDDFNQKVPPRWLLTSLVRPRSTRSSGRLNSSPPST